MMSSTLPADVAPVMFGQPASRGVSAVMKQHSSSNAYFAGPLADRAFGWLAKAAALLTLGLLIGILVSLLVGAWPAISKYGFGFLTSTKWDPVTEEFGGLVMNEGRARKSGKEKKGGK